jgi:hypothetical protein
MIVRQLSLAIGGSRGSIDVAIFLNTPARLPPGSIPTLIVGD